MWWGPFWICVWLRHVLRAAAAAVVQCRFVSPCLRSHGACSWHCQVGGVVSGYHSVDHDGKHLHFVAVPAYWSIFERDIEYPEARAS